MIELEIDNPQTVLEFKLSDPHIDTLNYIKNRFNNEHFLGSLKYLTIVKSKFLKNYRDYDFNNSILLEDKKYFMENMQKIFLSSVTKGHCSCFFGFYDLDYQKLFDAYEAESPLNNFFSLNKNSPLADEQITNATRSVSLLRELKCNIVITFSHDAEFMYKL